ncbi:hypothetical protein ACIQUY_31870 [Streptomyces sp. NPDC090231]|uniref:hypothetical protein n=1 Tax=unclassified Streptomyces TaxID=2593676 RepID=UPI0037FA27CC
MPDTTPSRPAMTMREIRDRLGHARPDTTPTTPAVWSEGDPLMEAMAAAVYEQCARHPEQPLTVDDPRTIAAVAATVARLVLGTTDQQPETAPAATCSAEYHGDDDGARLCIRAAQHTGENHTDKHGLHWSDTVAVYPVADGTFRTGLNVRAVLRRLADEAQQPETEAAYPTTTTWTVEAQEHDDTWTEWGDHYTSDKAHQLAAEFRTTRGARAIRVVRQVVTTAVEPAADQPGTETEAQQPTA